MWFLIALIIGIVVAALIMWTRSKNVSITWWQWLTGVLGVALLLLAVQHYAGSITEGYSQAGLMGLLIFGIPAIILLVVAGLGISRTAKA